MELNVLTLCYLIGSVTFILGLKMLSNPATARKGNLVAAAGMTIAIEPMATLGDYRVYVADDNWTILTYDGSWAAHFEHTVLITEQGAETLTQV